MADGGVGEGLTIASIAVTVAAAAASGAAAYSSSQYNKAAEEENAQAAQQQAAADAGQKATEGQQLLARQAATAAADGVDVNSGSLLDVQEDTSVNNELQQQLIKYRGAVGANQDQAQAGLDALQGQNALIGAAFSAQSGALSDYSTGYRNSLLQSSAGGTTQNPTIS